MENHLTGKLFIPILLISFLGFGMSFFPLALDGGIGPNAYLLLIISFLITILGLIGLHRSAFKYPGQSLVHEAGKLLGTFILCSSLCW
jgi:hypothetical protein